jgi:hypothetical protein
MRRFFNTSLNKNVQRDKILTQSTGSHNVYSFSRGTNDICGSGYCWISMFCKFENVGKALSLLISPSRKP